MPQDISQDPPWLIISLCSITSAFASKNCSETSQNPVKLGEKLQLWNFTTKINNQLGGGFKVVGFLPRNLGKWSIYDPNLRSILFQLVSFFGSQLGPTSSAPKQERPATWGCCSCTSHRIPIFLENSPRFEKSLQCCSLLWQHLWQDNYTRQ